MSSSIDSKLDQPDRRPWYRRFRVPLVIGVVMVGITLYLLATGFEAEVYRLKLQGEPTTLEECRKYLKLPVDDGAGELWQKAIESHEKARSIVSSCSDPYERGYCGLPSIGNGNAPRFADDWYPELPTAIEYLKHFEETSGFLMQAIVRREPIPFSTDLSFYMPKGDDILWVRGMLSLPRIARLEVITFLSEGRSKEAVDAVERLGFIERSFRSAPFDVRLSICFKHQGEFGELLRYLLSSRQLIAGDWRRIRASRIPFSPQQLQIACALIDRAMHVEYERETSLLVDSNAINRITYRASDVRHYTKMLAIARQDWHQSFFPIVEGRLSQGISEGNRYFLLSGMLAEARQRLHLAAIASKIFSIERGRVPESIDELVPDYLEKVPRFPATDDRMIMRENDQGELVFSYPVEPASDLTELKIPEFRYQVRPVDQTD